MMRAPSIRQAPKTSSTGAGAVPFCTGRGDPVPPCGAVIDTHCIPIPLEGAVNAVSCIQPYFPWPRSSAVV